jgi:ABC-type uncharacterized transport system substrate-binding protein
LSRSLSVLFLVMVIATVLLSNLNRPRVMILHSYSTDYSWTNGVNVGLRRVTDQWSNYAVTWHYMDTKKRSDNKWLQLAGLTARKAIEQWEPDVLIAVDNLAQELAAKHYVNHPDISIVFAGINGSIAPYGYQNADNVTGILELRQLDGLRETILALECDREKSDCPGANNRPIRVLYLLDASKSVAGDRRSVDDFHWEPLDYQGSYVAQDWDDWKTLVRSSAAKTDYLIVTNYRQLSCSKTDKHSSFVPASAVMAWTDANSPVPVIGLQVFNVEDGGMLAIGPSPYEQGEEVGRMAEAILKNRGKKDNRPLSKRSPIKPNKHYIVALRKPAMEQRMLRLPHIYESFARAANTYVESIPEVSQPCTDEN